MVNIDIGDVGEIVDEDHEQVMEQRAKRRLAGRKVIRSETDLDRH